MRLCQELAGGDAPIELVLALENARLHKNIKVSASSFPSEEGVTLAGSPPTEALIISYANYTMATATALLPHLWRLTSPILSSLVFLMYTCVIFPQVRHVVHPFARRLGLGGLLLGSAAVEPAPPIDAAGELADLPEVVSCELKLATCMNRLLVVYFCVLTFCLVESSVSNVCGTFHSLFTFSCVTCRFAL